MASPSATAHLPDPRRVLMPAPPRPTPIPVLHLLPTPRPSPKRRSGPRHSPLADEPPLHRTPNSHEPTSDQGCCHCSVGTTMRFTGSCLKYAMVECLSMGRKTMCIPFLLPYRSWAHVGRLLVDLQLTSSMKLCAKITGSSLVLVLCILNTSGVQL
ncbi:uncharacterized protein LOC123429956 [Hordeum vulgare subsp. vulgare]|uniref:uncharacterized protein LOC123429956 n=1 Tax=Hordeum vulgare subsp. vulgare TaxID=112509 RepID=UPI001D1A506D|nr:uncharacterized protein LOC123429956 [Hordeum vulgare subsp. vulgare]